jgi:ABC-type uncharacterized transport system substrate-binding protein
MTPRFAGLAAFFLLCLTNALWAHPHVWVEVKAEVTVAAGFVEGVWTDWTFDDEFSQLILADNDPGGTGKVDAKMNLSIKKSYFDNLKTYSYFSHFILGKRDLEIPAPQKFQASIGPQGKVTYRFFLPLGIRLDAKTPLAVSFYDDSYFTDMEFTKKAPLTLTVTDGGKAAVTFHPEKSKTFYGGQVTPIYAYISWSPS